MFGWVRRMLRRDRDEPHDERSIRAEQLDRAEAEVRDQTRRVKRIRLEAELAQRRLQR